MSKSDNQKKIASVITVTNQAYSEGAPIGFDVSLHVPFETKRVRLYCTYAFNADTQSVMIVSTDAFGGQKVIDGLPVKVKNGAGDYDYAGQTSISEWVFKNKKIVNGNYKIYLDPSEDMTVSAAGVLMVHWEFLNE